MKVTHSGPRTYLQIVHAYRDPETGRPKQRHIANLGRADQLDESDLDTLINGLLKFTNRTTLDEPHSEISSEGTRFSPALQVGDIWAILGILHQLKLAQTITRAVRSSQRRIDVEKLVRVMVMNRLSDPQSKLGLLRWLEQVYLPASIKSRCSTSTFCGRWMRCSSIRRRSRTSWRTISGSTASRRPSTAPNGSLRSVWCRPQTAVL